MDTDAELYCSQDLAKVFVKQEHEKKEKYLSQCLAQHKEFTPLVLSVDRLHGPEASVASQQPSISPCKMMEATLWSCVWLCVTQSVTGSYPVTHSQVTCLHTDDGAGYSLLVHPPCHKHYVTPPGPPPHLLTHSCPLQSYTSALGLHQCTISIA